MKKALLLVGALALIASSAFASGMDLSVVACPGDGGIQGDAGVADCVSGSPIIVLGTFSPAEAIPDLVAIDDLLIATASPDLMVSNFWNFDPNVGCGASTFNASQSRPTAGCATPVAYTQTWNTPNAGASVGAAINPGNVTENIACGVSRPSVLSVAAESKLFGFQILIDGSQASEAGGTCAGCTAGFCIAWNYCFPRSNGSVTPTQLTAPTGNFPGSSNVLSFNGGASLCGAVPTKKHSWGQLKSLYR